MAYSYKYTELSVKGYAPMETPAVGQEYRITVKLAKDAFLTVGKWMRG